MIIFPATSIITSDYCQPNRQNTISISTSIAFSFSPIPLSSNTPETPQTLIFLRSWSTPFDDHRHRVTNKFTLPVSKITPSVQHIFPYNTQLTLGRWKSKKISSSYVRRLSNHQEWTSRCRCFDPAWVIPLLHWMCPSLWDLVTPFRQDNNRPPELGPLSSQLNRFSDESSDFVRNYSILTCCLISTITGWFSIKFNWIAATGLRFTSTVRTRTTLDTEWFIRLIVIGYCALPIK